MNQRASVIFFAVLFNGLSSALEILALYVQRPIVPLYRPLSESVSSIICDLPSKIISTLAFNIPLYFMSSKTVHQALVPAATFIIGLVIYAGFVLPIRSMKGWLRWINYFSGRSFGCQTMIPSSLGYENIEPMQRTCSVADALPGLDFIDGDFFIGTVYKYHYSHLWRPVTMASSSLSSSSLPLPISAEYFSSETSKGEFLVFRKAQKYQHKETSDEEAANSALQPPRATSNDTVHSSTEKPPSYSTFCWRNDCYDVKVKGETCRILSGVNGWVQPGKLTALMSKLRGLFTEFPFTSSSKVFCFLEWALLEPGRPRLDVLADRVTMGVITGGILVNGLPRGKSFQRTTGYVQQQDIHLETSTVREALRFSAVLRQTTAISMQDKIDYVEEVINLLEMGSYADAVIGVPCKAWAIISLLKKLADHGLAILCTIHQPSNIIFQQFDRLLLLAKGGRAVYFGDVGENATALTRYFERHGAVHCRPENPAESMLHVIGTAPGAHTDSDWVETWKVSSEFQRVQEELDSLAQSRHVSSGEAQDTFYAASVSQQFLACTQRVAQQYWRTPTYIYSKLSLCFITSLFIGLSFQSSPLSLQGLQNQLFSIFMLLVIFAFLTYQIMPGFVTRRTLYEGRERSSKTYVWYNLILANTVIEMAWNSVASLAIDFPFYFLVGMYDNGRIMQTQHERGAFMFLLTWAFMVYEGTFLHMCVARAPTAEVGATLGLFLFMMSLLFCGVLVPYSDLPGFWTFMYCVSPLTYLIGAVISNGVGKQEVTCSEIEFLQFQTPANLTCGEYVGQLVQVIRGALSNPDSNQTCLTARLLRLMYTSEL
ncbi:ABC transporter CDR4 [Fusarium mundagurra]|uniref:ABC transporter CDR4 n=1 Tax=Fusarium mundagurra TaxID=1567541 RepID=A0A8H6DHU1_9HYPO|nr:ABC transporter CDR4 [Fusarium mundagurra]